RTLVASGADSRLPLEQWSVNDTARFKGLAVRRVRRAFLRSAESIHALLRRRLDVTRVPGGCERRLSRSNVGRAIVIRVALLREFERPVNPGLHAPVGQVVQ